MVEAKIKVEMAEFFNVDNPFYGKTITRKVYEESFLHDKDERDNIAPFGVLASIKLDKGEDDCYEIISIRANAHFLDCDDNGVYFAFFEINGRVFELSVSVNEDGTSIEDIVLSEWLDRGDFENGDDADNDYPMDAFTCYAEYFS